MNLKFKFDEMLNNDPTRPGSENEKVEQGTVYQYASHVRNVNFVLLNGDMEFFNYGYLISGKYKPAESLIALHFASHTVTLSGIRLLPLYCEFIKHLPENVVCMDARYNATAEDYKPIVNNISIEKNKS